MAVTVGAVVVAEISRGVVQRARVLDALHVLPLLERNHRVLPEATALRDWRLGVVGLGYVGLALAVAFARAGLRTIGCDVDRERTDAIGRAESYILDVQTEEVRAAVESSALAATADFAGLARVDAIVICVPTPLGKAGDPDLSHVTAAVDHVAARLRAGQLVVLESMPAAGMARDWPGGRRRDCRWRALGIRPRREPPRRPSAPQSGSAW